MLFYESVSLGKIVDFSFKLVFSNLKNYLKVFAIYMGIVLGVSFIFGISIFFIIKNNGINPTDFPYSFKNSNFLNSLIIGGIFGFIFLIIIWIAAIFYLIMSFDIFIKAFLEEQWILKDSFNLAKNKFFSTLLLSFLSFLMCFGGFLLCCIGILPVAVLIIFAFPILIFENLSAVNAISRSIELVTKDFIKTFGYFFVLFFIVMGFSTIYQVFLSIVQIIISVFMVHSQEFTIDKIIIIAIIFTLLFIIYIAYSIFISAFSNAYYVLLYFNYKIKYENFGVENLISKMPEEEPEKKDYETQS